MVDRGRHVSSGHTGTVQFYNDDGGYGFVSTDFEDGDGDIFFHISESARERLVEGDELEYAVYESDEGYQACLIRVVEEATSGDRDRRRHHVDRSELPRDHGGKVTHFDKSGGYGFISDVSGVNDDVFIHISNADTNKLRVGDRVEFHLTDGKEGPEAMNLAVTKRASSSSGSGSDHLSSSQKKQRKRMAGKAPDVGDGAKDPMKADRKQKAASQKEKESGDPENKNKLLQGDQ